MPDISFSLDATIPKWLIVLGLIYLTISALESITSMANKYLEWRLRKEMAKQAILQQELSL